MPNEILPEIDPMISKCFTNYGNALKVTGDPNCSSYKDMSECTLGAFMQVNL